MVRRHDLPCLARPSQQSVYGARSPHTPRMRSGRMAHCSRSLFATEGPSCALLILCAGQHQLGDRSDMPRIPVPVLALAWQRAWGTW